MRSASTSALVVLWSFIAWGQSLCGCLTTRMEPFTSVRHLSSSRNVLRLIYSAYLFRARIRLLSALCKAPFCSLGRQRRYNFVTLGLHYRIFPSTCMRRRKCYEMCYETCVTLSSTLIVPVTRRTTLMSDHSFPVAAAVFKFFLTPTTHVRVSM